MKFLRPLVFILISQLAGVIGSVFTSSAIPGWYSTLDKPSFNPPNWIFGPMWVTLYVLMGIASYLIWKRRGDIKSVKISLIIFFAHLILNALWSIIFFGLHNPMLAFFEIVILWLSILLLIGLFYRIDKRASYLLIPYLLWVSFASILNYSIWKLN
ncbi:MAG: TspO/MBR family protein [Patescibacteria group bacterium]